jgi:hypothetical protein
MPDSAFSPTIPTALAACMQAAKAEFTAHGVYFLEEAYIRSVCSHTNAFPALLPFVLETAARVRSNADLALYALFYSRAMEHRAEFSASLSALAIPEEEPMLPFLAMIPWIGRVYDTLRGRHLPADVIAATVDQFESCVFLYEERFDRKGLSGNYISFLQHTIDDHLLGISRLRFEMLTLRDPIRLLRHKHTGERVLLFGGGAMDARGLYAGTPPASAEAFTAAIDEDDTAWSGCVVNDAAKCLPERRRFAKSDWTLLLGPGDPVLNVHIPAHLPLTREALAESYRRAPEIFRTCYGFAPKGFLCRSWMMSEELHELLSPTSNILMFQEPYHRFPIRTGGTAVYNFVFKLRFKTFADMPEDTSLQRAVKRRYLDGGHVFEYGGVFVPGEDFTDFGRI